MSQLVLPFDYDALPPQDRDWLQEQKRALDVHCREIVRRIIHIGRIFEEVKHRLPRHFGRWTDSCTHFSRSKVFDYRQIATVFGPIIDELCPVTGHSPPLKMDVGALTMLAQSPVKMAARTDAVKRAMEGEVITLEVAREIRDLHHPPHPKLFPENPTPPTTAADDSRAIAALQKLARESGPVVVDTTTDTEYPEDVLYTLHIVGKPLASGRTLPDAVDAFMGTVQTKPCTQCGKTLPRSHFTVKRGHKDGLASECRTCSRERVNAAKVAKQEAA